MFVCGGIGETNADMPEANAMCNVIGPTGNKRFVKDMDSVSEHFSPSVKPHVQLQKKYVKQFKFRANNIYI